MKHEKCIIDNCKNNKFANNLCPKHNRRLERHGDPNYINPKCNRDGGTEERRKAYFKEFYKNNPKIFYANAAQYKKRVRLATPKWADLEAIKEFYRNCPKGYHVDHIIPLRGSTISGLHVLENLQYLPAADNLKKSNKF